MKMIIKVKKESGSEELSWFMNYLFLYMKDKEINKKHAISIRSKSLKDNIVFKIKKFENKENFSLIYILIDKEELNQQLKSFFISIFEEFLSDFIDNQQYDLKISLDFIEKY